MIQRRVLEKPLVLVVCPCRLVREGLASLFSQDEDLQLSELVVDARQALDSIANVRPDLVILVGAGDTKHCLAILTRLKSSYPELPVLIISLEIERECVQAALTQGAKGYLPLDTSPDEVVHAVHTVLDGEVCLHPTVLLDFLSDLSSASVEQTDPDMESLSPREQEVLACLARGLSDRDIAQTLFISVRTVQTHLAHLYTKMGVHSRTEAALLAVQSSWFPIEGTTS